MAVYGAHLARAVILLALALLLIGDLAAILGKVTSSLDQAFELMLLNDLTTIFGDIKTSVEQRTDRKEKLDKIATTLKNACLPKLICELNASTEKDKLSPKAKSLLQLIRDTSISTTADSVSMYHFAAHMGQLISGVEGNGCYNFFPNCPLPSIKVLSLLDKSTPSPPLM